MPTKPKIVVIECDSMDGRVMGCMDHPAAISPNMDRLARLGGLFRNAYCSSPQCCPSRASRWSGKHVHEVQAWNNARGLSPEDPTYLTRLEDAGYRAHIEGKTDYVSGAHSLGARVCAWTRAADIRLPQRAGPVATLSVLEDDVARVHPKDWEVVDRSVEWLSENADTGGPFFLDCSASKPHPAFRTSAKWLSKIDPERVDVPLREHELHPVMDYMSATKNYLQDFAEEEIVAVRRTYFAMIAEVDAHVGRLLQVADDLGLAQNTYIIFTSDHGEMNMEHGQYLKNSVYEASARVPLIIAGPGVERDAVVDDPVSLVDFYPTLTDMADLPTPDGLAGRSLMPYLCGQSRDGPAGVLSEYHSNFTNTGIFMLRSGAWKYVAYPGYGPQLFDLDRDPEEMEDLAAIRSDVVDRMDAQLRRIVDYTEVDARAKACDRECFVAWREQLGEPRYREAMVKLYPDWGREQDGRVEAWLAGG